MDLASLWTVITSDEAAKGLGFTLALLMRRDVKKVKSEFVAELQEIRKSIANFGKALESLESNHGTRLLKVERDVQNMQEKNERPRKV